MISQTLWTLLLIQIALGAADTLFHHELTERLAWRPKQARELRLHGARNLIYALVFAALGFSEPRGAWAIALIALLLVEAVITLVDFVEEDRTRTLPWTERVLHTLLTLNYGVLLALLIPLLIGWAAHATAILPQMHGWLSAFMGLAVFGVAISGVRDLAAAARCARLVDSDPAALVDALVGRQSILVTGGTGFVGTRLVYALIGAGHHITLLTRNPAKARALPTPIRIITTLDQFADDDRLDCIINLAGEPIANGLWTKAKRANILDTRIMMTRGLIALCERLHTRPAVLISGSAIGYYGVRETGVCDEGEAAGHDFCARVCTAWEAEAERAMPLGIRTIRLRIGLVLGRGGGMLANLLFLFESGLGGRMGGGAQVMSWIHRDDLIRLIAFCIARSDMAGAVNATAPNPVTNADFTRTLAATLRRPTLLAIPAAPLRWLAGGLAEELLLGGQNVLPVKAVFHGFGFGYPRLAAALAECTGAKCETSAPKYRAIREARLLS